MPPVCQVSTPLRLKRAFPRLSRLSFFFFLGPGQLLPSDAELHRSEDASAAHPLDHRGIYRTLTGWLFSMVFDYFAAAGRDVSKRLLWNSAPISCRFLSPLIMRLLRMTVVT